MTQKIRHYLFFVAIGVYFTLSRAIPIVFALNDTTKTWTFNTAGASSYTYDSSLVTVDDTGAHPVANKLTNPVFTSDNSSWSVAAVPPSGWVEIPGDSNYSTTNFLVMKYDAKCDTNGDGTGDVTASGDVCNGSENDDGTGDQYGIYRNSGTGCACTGAKKVVSTAGGFPLAYINQTNSATYCTGVTLNGNAAHLITNNEWMTTVRNAELQNANWCNSDGTSCGNAPGTAGKVMANGHNDSNNEAAAGGDTASAIIASTDDTKACYGTTTDGSNNCGGAGSQKRTLTLSNGAVVWDFGGNVYNWTNNTILGTNKPVGSTIDWVEWTTVSNYKTLSYNLTRPSVNTYNSTQGVGKYFEGTSTGGPYAFQRGGCWYNGSTAGPFSMYLNDVPTLAFFAGFRCASNPVAISQSFSSSSGLTGGGDTVTIGSISDGKIYQSVNVGDTSTYDFSVYVYNNTTGHAGEAVTSDIASLYYNGSTVTTSYDDSDGDHWYKLTGTITGVASSVEAGLLVKSGKTVKVDDFILSKQGTYSVYTTSAYSNPAVSSWDSFSASVTASGNAAVYYQICLDDGSSCSYSSGSRWQYYTAGAWTNASDATTTYANTAAQLTQTAMQALTTSSQKISVKAVMNFDVTDVPYLTSLQIGLSTDSNPPSISLTALSPDPDTNNTPYLTGTATDAMGTVSNVQFQMDGTSGSWSNCTANDGSFDSASETFTCTVATALSDGLHTMYVRTTDSNNNTTTNANAATDTFTIDTTAPVSFDLDSPGDNSYTNSERPTFKWKATSDATSGLSKYVLEIDNPSAGSGQPSGDFTIDNIPVNRTTDYETNKYVIHYEKFSDSDSTNNYISVYTKSSTEWSSDSNSGQNDGKLREGKVIWKVKTRDNAGNETSSSRTLFVDRTSPKVEFTQINKIPFSSPSFSTTDKTPTIFGKITDPLSGEDSSLAQDENGPKVASGPKQVEIKLEEKKGLTYKLHTLYTINVDKPWYSCDGKEVTDNSRQKCDKYLSFEFTPEQNLDLGTYLITIIGKDKADNTSSSQQLALNISTFAQITTHEEKKAIEEILKELPKEEQKKFKEGLEITKPTEAGKPTVLERMDSKIADIFANLWWGLVDSGKTTINVLANTWNNYQAFVVETNQKSLVLTKIIVGRTTSTITKSLAFTDQQLGKTLTAFGKTTQILLTDTRQSIGNTTKSIGEGYHQLANNAAGNGVLATGKTVNSIATIATSNITNISETISDVARSTTAGVETVGKTIANATNSVGKGMSQTVNIITGVGVKLAQNIGATTNIFGPLATDVSNKTSRFVQKISTFEAIASEYWFDREPTKILAVSVEKVTSTSVVIYWKTNDHATSAVNYGFDTSYGKKVQSDELVQEHRMELTNLEQGKTYFFEVMSQNKNYVYDAYYNFTTPPDNKIKGVSTEKQMFEKPFVSVVGDKNDWILVRRAPSRESDVVAKVQVGQTLPLLKKQDGWLLIKVNGSEGWMFGEFGKLIEPQE